MPSLRFACTAAGAVLAVAAASFSVASPSTTCTSALAAAPTYEPPPPTYGALPAEQPPIPTSYDAQAAAGDAGPAPDAVVVDAAPTTDTWKFSDKRMICAINEARKRAGVPGLRLSAELDKAAGKFAKHLSLKRELLHTSPKGQTPGVRADEMGFGWLRLSEVVARVWKDELEVVQNLLKDPKARENLLDPKVSRVGVAGHQCPIGRVPYYVIMQGCTQEMIPGGEVDCTSFKVLNKLPMHELPPDAAGGAKGA